MTIPREDLELVRRSVPVANLLHNYGLDFHLSGNKLRGPCPECGGGERSTKCVVLDNDYVFCHGCGFKGDVYAVCMLLARTDLPGAYELLGGKLGLPNVGYSSQLPLVAKPRLDRSDDCEKSNRTYWDGLARQDDEGERYLRKRSIETQPDEVRFDRGDPCVPLRAYEDGRVINVMRRRRNSGSGPKTLLKRGSGRGCFGHVQHLGQTIGELVITEGWADYLTAIPLFPDNLVIGARDAGSIPRVVEALARAAPGRRMAVVMHPDAAGRAGVCKAIQLLGDGDSVDHLIRVLVPRTGDLNDTWMEASRGNR